MLEKIAISQGNSKLGKIPNFSLTPGKTCSNEACQTCLKDCYAMKAYNRYGRTREAWDRNTRMATDHLEETFKQLEAYFVKKHPKFFRVHVAGDFISETYAVMWERLGWIFPDINFLAFTKRWDIVDKIGFSDNFSIVYSAWPDCPQPPSTRPIAWMQDGTEKRIPDTALNCPGHCTGCGMCWQIGKIGRDVYFDKH